MIHATGPASYDYQFGRRALFNGLSGEAWFVEGTLFGFDATTLAVADDGELLGIEIGFGGGEFGSRIKALEPIWASYLNPVLPANAYYIHAIAVRPTPGGAALVRH